jgi:NDP-sugar pyrophosphorylase family protein
LIKTSVIFCGGYGSRLGLITKDKPKPMVIVNKKPFLEHIILQLKSFGIEKVYILVGYKQNKIINYFKKNNKGLKIFFNYCPPEKETGFRLNQIKQNIKEDFLLMYSDNYCPVNIKKNLSIFKKNKSLITFSVCKKKIGNVSINKKDKARYFLKRKKILNYVDVGYMICSHKLLNIINNDNVSINKYFNHKKIYNNLTAINIPNKYLSISDPDRLSETRKYFKKKNIILIDRDGVLNLKNKKFRYVRNINELKLNHKLIKILIKFPKIKYICITNQAGINTGDIEKKKLVEINLFIKNYLKDNNIDLIEYFI